MYMCSYIIARANIQDYKDTHKNWNTPHTKESRSYWHAALGTSTGS